MAATHSRKRNIFIIGAQCTGKTTLVNALESSFAESDQFNTPVIVREVARTTLKDKNFSREDITSSVSRALELQKHILDAQFDAEQVARETGGWYMCDRSGLDPIVYAQVFVGKEAATQMLACDQWLKLEKGMKNGLVFLCEAGCSWLVDDGTRLMPTGPEDWMRIDTAFRELLEARGIDHVVVPRDMTSMEARIKLVKEAVGADKSCMAVTGIEDEDKLD